MSNSEARCLDTFVKRPVTRTGWLEKQAILLTAAEAKKLDVFFTVDQGIEYQQCFHRVDHARRRKV